MNRFFRILAALSLVMVLASVVLAFTVMRPRTEVMAPTFKEEGWVKGIPRRSSDQVTRKWKLSPPGEWSFGTYYEGAMHSPWLEGWQYGPFAFEEKHEGRSWPVPLEKAARAIAAQKLGVNELGLEIEIYWLGPRWHVVASAPGGKRLEMEFQLSWDDQGKPRFLRRS